MVIKIISYNGKVIGKADKLRWIEYPYGELTNFSIDRREISEIFARNYVHVNSQKLPFNVELNDQRKSIVENSWIANISDLREFNNFVLIPKLKFEAERVVSRSTTRKIGDE